MTRPHTRVEFERFVADSVDELLRTAYVIVWDEAEAEDLVQESFIRVAKRWPRVRTMERPQAYLRRVLVNLALDGRKRRARWRQELDRKPQHDAADDGSARDMSRVDDRDELLCALATLPPRQRAVLACGISPTCPRRRSQKLWAVPSGRSKATPRARSSG